MADNSDSVNLSDTLRDIAHALGSDDHARVVSDEGIDAILAAAKALDPAEDRPTVDSWMLVAGAVMAQVVTNPDMPRIIGTLNESATATVEALRRQTQPAFLSEVVTLHVMGADVDAVIQVVRDEFDHNPTHPALLAAERLSGALQMERRRHGR